MADEPTNGWRTGKDPVQRWLGYVVECVLVGTFVYLAVDPDRGMDAVTMGGLCLGVVLIFFGYGRLVHLPGIGRRDDE